MRWIFFTLAIVNLLTFAWGMVATSRDNQPDRPKNLRNPYTGFPELLLLSEINASGPSMALSTIERSPEPEQEVEPSTENSIETELPPSRDGKLLCEMVGPFANNEVANDFVERLTAIEIASSIRELELPAGPGYWVYLEPQSSRRDALRLLSELQSKRIDSYVIPKGDLANGISLGMFSKKSLSDARVREMAAIGLTPLVEEIERTYRELWVMLEPGEDLKMSKLTWERVMEEINMLERRQNYCLDVASQ